MSPDDIYGIALEQVGRFVECVTLGMIADEMFEELCAAYQIPPVIGPGQSPIYLLEMAQGKRSTKQ